MNRRWPLVNSRAPTTLPTDAFSARPPKVSAIIWCPKQIPNTGLPAYLDIGRVASLEINRKAADVAKQGQTAAVKIDAVTSIAFGRQFDHTYSLYSRVTRNSIDALKEFFREDCERSDWDLLVRLKKQFGVI